MKEWVLSTRYCIINAIGLDIKNLGSYSLLVVDGRNFVKRAPPKESSDYPNGSYFLELMTKHEDFGEQLVEKIIEGARCICPIRSINLDDCTWENRKIDHKNGIIEFGKILGKTKKTFLFITAHPSKVICVFTRVLIYEKLIPEKFRKGGYWRHAVKGKDGAYYYPPNQRFKEKDFKKMRDKLTRKYIYCFAPDLLMEDYTGVKAPEWMRTSNNNKIGIKRVTEKMHRKMVPSLNRGNNKINKSDLAKNHWSSKEAMMNNYDMNDRIAQIELNTNVVNRYIELSARASGVSYSQIPPVGTFNQLKPSSIQYESLHKSFSRIPSQNQVSYPQIMPSRRNQVSYQSIPSQNEVQYQSMPSQIPYQNYSSMPNAFPKYHTPSLPNQSLVRQNQLSHKFITPHSSPSFIMNSWANETRAKKVLKLKIGVKVICVYNVSDTCFNGASGKVVSFVKVKEENFKSVIEMYDNAINENLYLSIIEFIKINNGEVYFPIVKFSNDENVLIIPREFSVSSGLITVKRVQIPLKLGYAITVHGSQGMTLERGCLGKNIWLCGQFYVGISRVRELKNLYLSYFTPEMIKVDWEILEHCASPLKLDPLKIKNKFPKFQI